MAKKKDQKLKLYELRYLVDEDGNRIKTINDDISGNAQTFRKRNDVLSRDYNFGGDEE